MYVCIEDSLFCDIYCAVQLRNVCIYVYTSPIVSTKLKSCAMKTKSYKIFIII